MVALVTILLSVAPPFYPDLPRAPFVASAPGKDAALLLDKENRVYVGGDSTSRWYFLDCQQSEQVRVIQGAPAPSNGFQIECNRRVVVIVDCPVDSLPENLTGPSGLYDQHDSTVWFWCTPKHLQLAPR